MEAIAPVAIILGAPILAAEPFRFRFGFVENILVRLLMVGAIIYAVLEDKLLGLFVFLAVFTLLLERNHAIALTIGKKPVITSEVNSLGYVKSPAPAEEGVKDPLPVRANEIGDSNPRLSPAPERSEAGAFFKSLGL